MISLLNKICTFPYLTIKNIHQNLSGLFKQSLHEELVHLKNI